MRSHRLRSRTAQSALQPGSDVSIGDVAIRIAAPGARARVDARGTAWECVHRRAGAAGARTPRMRSTAPGPVRAASGPRAPTGAPAPRKHRARRTWRRSPTTGPPHRSPSPTAPRSTPSRSTPRHRPIRSPFRTGPPSRSTTARLPRRHFSVSSGATLAIGNGGSVEIGSLAGAGALQLGASDPNTILFIAGSTSTTFSGVISGPGTIEIDDAALLTVDRHGQRDRRRSRPLQLCSTGSLTIDGGSLTVNGPAQGVTVEGGTLSVINGGTLQVGTAGRQRPPRREQHDHQRRRLERDGDQRLYRHRHLRPGPRSPSPTAACSTARVAPRSMPLPSLHADSDGDRPRLDLERRRVRPSGRRRQHRRAGHAHRFQRRRCQLHHGHHHRRCR